MAEKFALTKSRAFLSVVYNRSSELQQRNTCFSPERFEAAITSRDIRTTGASPPIAIGINASGADLWIAVLDVERWTSHDLHTWEMNTAAEQRLETLRKMITCHDRIASSLKKSPELFSRVFLVILEFWVALDKAVTEVIPLLNEYSPELSIDSFEPLVLPSLCQMKRLQVVEDYLQKRHESVREPYRQHSLFKFSHSSDSFAARYFQKNDDLQQLQSRIEAEATLLRDNKIEDCARLNEEYHRRKRENNQRSDEYYSDFDKYGDPEWRHSRSCPKCREKQALLDMRITVFEWPLPENDILSRLVVFELRLPKAVGVWRDISYRLARNYSCDTPSSRSIPTPILRDYPALKKYFSSNIPEQQITIASTAKSFLVSHYRERGFPCEKSEVVKRHALGYRLYDVASDEWIPSIFPIIAIRENCTAELCGPYMSLAWTLHSMSHTSNKIIASQSMCQTELSHHEWDAFGHIRSGHRLQWRNMILEVVNGTLDAGDANVHLLFQQAAWQVEKRSSVVYREAHIDLADEGFGLEVLDVLRGKLGCIRNNWQEGWTASTLNILACRLFSLTKSEVVTDSVREFLSSLRQIMWQWLDQVLHQLKVYDSQIDLRAKLATDLRSRVIQLATACRSTFALDPKEVSFLFKESKNVSMFIKCAMVLQANTPGDLTTLPAHLRYVVERNMVLSVEKIILHGQCLLDNAEGIEDAIRYVWQGFQRDPSRPWRKITDRWIACQSFTQDNTDKACHFHMNLLDGTLLFDGKTLGNLPKGIVNDPLFKRVFPNQVCAAFSIDWGHS